MVAKIKTKPDPEKARHYYDEGDNCPPCPEQASLQASTELKFPKARNVMDIPAHHISDFTDEPETNGEGE